jgi:glutamate-1-semialdehyde aminotransferase
VRAGRQLRGIPAAPGILAGAFGDVRVLDYGTPESMAWLREHAEDLAAVLVEPVQSRRPDFQPVAYLREVRELTQAHGACLIFDEVITGFRAHLGGVQAAFGIQADLATYGKVIGGGLPIGVVAGKREYMDALDGGHWQFGDESIPTVGVTYFAGTFVRHPLALAAAHAALTHLKAQGPALQQQLNARTTSFVERVNQACSARGAPLMLKHFGSLWRVSWLADHPLQDLLFAMMRSRGVHILDNFPCFFTTAHSDADIALVESALIESVAELQAAGFLPGGAEPANETVQAPPSAVTASSADAPPVPGARSGRDKEGRTAWFVPDPERPGRYKRWADDSAVASR